MSDETNVEQEETKPPAEEEWTPPSKEEWDKVTGTLAKRKEEAAAARREAAAAKEEAAKLRNGGKDDEAAKQAAAAQSEADNRVRRSAGIAALVEAGMTRQQAKDAVDLLKLKDLDIDQDGDVAGVDDAVESLKERFPGMFAKPATKPGKQRTVDTSGAGDGKTKTPTERTSDRLLKAAGLA